MVKIRLKERYMAKTFEEMTKAELIKATEGFGLLDGVIGTEKADKVKNDVYIDALNEYKEKMNAKAPKGASKAKIPPVDEIRALRAEDLLVSIPVIVTNHDHSVDITDDTELRGEEFTWGNRHVGGTARVFRHGERQFLQKGAIKALRAKVIPRYKADNAGNYKIVGKTPKYTITEVEGFTEVELEALQKKQAMLKMD